MDWQPIETLEFKLTRSGDLASDDVVLWIDQFGPVIGSIYKLKRYGGGFVKSAYPRGFDGRDMESEFRPEEVTHWAHLPIGPDEGGK